MNWIGKLIYTLSFDDTANRAGLALRKFYFATAYNTMLPVNIMLVLGSLTPYVVYLALRHELTAGTYLAALGITLISAYFYNLVYVVNDLIDRRKDEALRIPKLTARHVLGEGYLTNLALSYVVVVTAAGLAWHRLLVPLVAYGIGLMALSVVHSKAKRGKAITVFVERCAKFCSPFALVYAATGEATAKYMLAAALIAYPLGFTLDYAYHGYLRDRLHMRSNWRWWLYGAYWLAAAVAIVAVGRHADVQTALSAFDLYLMIYFLSVTLAYIVADSVKFGFLSERYPERVAAEKRLLLSYGMMQLGIVIAGAVYVAVK